MSHCVIYIFSIQGYEVLWWVCLSVCLFTCLSARITHMAELHQTFCTSCLWPWLNPVLTALRYVMYCWFFEWRHVYICNLHSSSYRWRGMCSSDKCIAVEVTAVFCIVAVSSGRVGKHWKLVPFPCNLSVHVAHRWPSSRDGWNGMWMLSFVTHVWWRFDNNSNMMTAIFTRSAINACCKMFVDGQESVVENWWGATWPSCCFSDRCNDRSSWFSHTVWPVIHV